MLKRKDDGVITIPEIILRLSNMGIEVTRNKTVERDMFYLLTVLNIGCDDTKRPFQSDFYQLYAYGQKYLSGKGDIFLIYPLHKKFNEPLPAFSFSEELRLWIVPFDLSIDKLLLPEQFQLLNEKNSFKYQVA